MPLYALRVIETDVKLRRLEPYTGKLVRAVLRRGGAIRSIRNAPSYPTMLPVAKRVRGRLRWRVNS